MCHGYINENRNEKINVSIKIIILLQYNMRSSYGPQRNVTSPPGPRVQPVHLSGNNILCIIRIVLILIL